MYRTISFEVSESHRLWPYFEQLCCNYKNLYNVTNYLIRNTMTGIKKAEHDRTQNEKEVLDKVFTAIENVNQRREKKFSFPTKKHWMLGSEQIDNILRIKKDPDYYSLPAQVNQAAIKDCVEAWNSYFSSLRSYKQCSTSFTGKPRIPKYRKNRMTTVTLSNQICKIQGNELRFPKSKVKFAIGHVIDPTWKLCEVKVQPFYGRFRVLITIDDGKELQSSEHKPKRIIGIDLGVTNFAAIANNIGITPVVIKGGFLKSRNQYFNKRMAKLKSVIDTPDSKKKDIQDAECQIQRLCRARQRFFHDAFYKIAHRICHYAVKNKIDTIVSGKNDGWKQEANTGRRNNQNFVQIPHAQFLNILHHVCNQYGIQYLEQEESYTSKASLLDMDKIPVYGKSEEKPKFQGKRVKRGLYCSKDGIVINADINGSGNIIRKMVPDAFKKQKDLKYLSSTEIWNFHTFFKTKSSSRHRE